MYDSFPRKGNATLEFKYINGAQIICSGMDGNLALLHAHNMRAAIERGDVSYRIKFWSRKEAPNRIELSSVRVGYRP